MCIKKTEIQVFQHLIMKNDIVFQFFQQKQKIALFPANLAYPATVTTLQTDSCNISSENGSELKAEIRPQNWWRDILDWQQNGQVTYFWTIDENNKVFCNLIIAKSHVACLRFYLSTPTETYSCIINSERGSKLKAEIRSHKWWGDILNWQMSGTELKPEH